MDTESFTVSSPFRSRANTGDVQPGEPQNQEEPNHPENEDGEIQAEMPTQTEEEEENKDQENKPEKNVRLVDTPMSDDHDSCDEDICALPAYICPSSEAKSRQVAVKF